MKIHKLKRFSISFSISNGLAWKGKLIFRQSLNLMCVHCTGWDMKFKFTESSVNSSTFHKIIIPINNSNKNLIALHKTFQNMPFLKRKFQAFGKFDGGSRTYFLFFNAFLKIDRTYSRLLKSLFFLFNEKYWFCKKNWEQFVKF